MARFATSGRPEGVPVEPGRWNLLPLAIALFLGAISVAMAATVPRTSELPDRPPVPGGAPTPRADARNVHIAGMGLGVFAVGAFLFFWIRRPHDSLRDLAPSAPTEAKVIDAPTNDRIVVRGRELKGRRVAVGPDGEPRVVPDAQAGYLHLPGADPDYRRRAGGVITLVGPGSINGLKVAHGARAPVLDGDRVQLPGARAFTVSLPRPGRALRYLWTGARVRLVGRVPSASTWPMTIGFGVVAIAGFVALHLDTDARFLSGSALLVLAALAATRVPPRFATRAAVDLSLDDLQAEGGPRVTLTRRPGVGVRVEVDGRHVAWLQELGRLTDDGRRALRAALERELTTLSGLPRAPRGSSASSS